MQRAPSVMFSGAGSSDILDDHTAVGLGAGGMGGDVVHILPGCMDHMALVGVHGLQGGAAAGIFLFSFSRPIKTQLNIQIFLILSFTHQRNHNRSIVFMNI